MRPRGWGLGKYGEPKDRAETCLLSHSVIYSLTAALMAFIKMRPYSERKPVYLWKESVIFDHG